MKKDTKKKNRGFSLIELVIVVAIMAILVGVLAPQYIKYVEKSRKSADATNVDSIVTSFKIAAADDATSLTAGHYKFTFGNNKDIAITYATDGTTFSAPSDAIKGAVDAAMVAAMGDNWEKTTLKSKQWVTGGTSEVTATIIYNADGSCEVSYTPEALKNLIAGTTPTPEP